MIGVLLVIISLILFIISKMIKRNVKLLKKKYKIQKGKILYQDLNKPAKPFFSKRYRVTGKPDYVVNNHNCFIPIEVKTGTHDKPQKNHILQLAAYCQLIEENYERFVPYGILVYSDKSQYKIPFDPKIRFEFESTVKEIRQNMKTGMIARNHNDLFKCKKCSMRLNCDFKLI